MKELIIIGAGGNGREIAWIAKRRNRISRTWKSISFVDNNNLLVNTRIENIPVIGNIEYLLSIDKYTDVICSIANPKIRKMLISQVSSNSKINFPMLIDPTATIAESVKIMEGVVIGINTVISLNSRIERFTLINTGCTLGHDFTSGEYVSIYPGVNIAGHVTLEKNVQVGSGSQILQGLIINSDSFIGAGAVVVKNITSSGIYIGIPARKLIKVKLND